MSVRFDTASAVATPVSTEGIALTTGPQGNNPNGVPGVPMNLVIPPGVGVLQGLSVKGAMLVTLGVGATGASVRIRQGSSGTGVQRGPDFNVQGAAGNTIAIPFGVLDTSAFALQNPGVQYTIDVIQTGAPTGAGTVTFVYCEIDVVYQ